MTAVSERDRIGGEELKKLERIRRAALKSFATRRRCRDIASLCRRGCGRIPRAGAAPLRNQGRPHQGCRRLRDERGDRDGFATAVSRTRETRSPTWAAGSPTCSSSTPTSWITSVAHSSTAVTLGTTIWDTLAAFGTARWNTRKETGEARDDIDVTWAALNSLVLALGTLILRGHIERQVAGCLFCARAAGAVAGVRQHPAA